MDGSPGLVVMGGDSISRGHEFESRHQILEEFSHLFVLKACQSCYTKEDIIGQKRKFTYRVMKQVQLHAE